jgi:hypothetical protein
MNSEIKPVSIKTAKQRLKEKFPDVVENYQCDVLFSTQDEARELRAALEALQAENAKLKEELERERMRLAACGVAALENTKNCVNTRISKDNPYYSESYSTVCRAVDEEIRLRDENTAQVARIAELKSAVKANHDHHIEYDDENCYPDSALYSINTDALLI